MSLPDRRARLLLTSSPGQSASLRGLELRAGKYLPNISRMVFVWNANKQSEKICGCPGPVAAEIFLATRLRVKLRSLGSGLFYLCSISSQAPTLPKVAGLPICFLAASILHNQPLCRTKLIGGRKGRRCDLRHVVHIIWRWDLAVALSHLSFLEEANKAKKSQASFNEECL